MAAIMLEKPAGERVVGDRSGDAESATSQDTPTKSPPRRRIRRHSNTLLGRRNAERINRETILLRSEHLSKTHRALLTAYYDLGMKPDELAALHRVSIHRIRYLLQHLRGVLSDPCFILATQFADRLPVRLATLTRAYFIEGHTLREIAATQNTSLYRIRADILVARSMLILAMAEQQHVPANLVYNFLDDGAETRDDGTDDADAEQNETLDE